jgi:hypothetical protein
MFLDGWMGGWMGGWVGVKAVLRIAYSNQKWCYHFRLLMSNVIKGTASTPGADFLFIGSSAQFSTPNFFPPF